MRYMIAFVITFVFHIPSPAQVINKRPFTLEGTIQGKDSGYMYLNYKPAGDKGILDSGKLEKGHFIIKGSIVEPTRAFLTTWNGFDAASQPEKGNIGEFYIDPATMKLSAVNHQFDDLQLTGSASNDEYSGLNASKKSLTPGPVRTGIDSIFILQHPDSYVAADMLSHSAQWIAFPSWETIYSKFTKRIKESFPGKDIKYQIDREKLLSIGSPAKNFRALDHKNDIIDLAAYKGKKYVLLDFGASWCIPCRQILPLLKGLYAKYGAALEIISIANQDEVEDWWKTVRTDQLEWPQILENKKNLPIAPAASLITDAYYITSMPTLILVDKDSRIIAKFGGGYKNKPAFALRDELKNIFEK